MAQDYGLKIMKMGYDALTDNDIRHMILSSKFPFLNYHGQASGVISWATGDSDIKYIDIAHGLSYIPLVVAYRGNIDDFDTGAGQTILPNSHTAASGDTITFYPYVDATKIRIKMNLADCYYFGGGYQDYNYAMFNSESYSTDYMIWGKKSGSTYYSDLSFSSIMIEQGESIKSASLEFYLQSKGGGTGDLKSHVVGFDQDWSYTSAYKNNNNSLPPPGEWIGIDVKDIVQEIINRGSWSSGNGMGFNIEDNGSNDNVWARSEVAQLTILLNRNVSVQYRVIVFKNKIA